MDYKFLTPLQVWSGFNPVKEPLEVSIFQTEQVGDVLYTYLYYTVLTEKDGKVRGFMSIAQKQDWLHDRVRRPAVIMLPTSFSYTQELSDILLNNGYLVAVADFVGEAPDKQFFTSYPESLAYGNLLKAGTHLNTVTSSSQDTCFYLWSQVARRAITLLAAQPNVDDSKIALIGETLGAQVVWQVAGVDGRPNAVVPMLGGGYTEYAGKYKYSADNTINMTEERNCWLAGTAAQAYAQFVTCPVYYLTGTNSETTDFDRASDILQITPVKEKLLLATPMTNRQISKRAIESLVIWLNEIVSGDGVVHEEIELSFEVSQGRLYTKVNAGKQVADVSAYCAYEALDPTARNWRRLKKPAVTGDNEYLYEVPVYDAQERVFVFVNAAMTDGVAHTSKVITCIPGKEKVTFVNEDDIEDRIIYDSTKGIDVFVVESDKVFLEEGIMSVLTGPMSLKGITTREGRLVTYKLQESIYSQNKLSILQLHAYSESKRTVRFVAYLLNGSATYSTEVTLNCNGKWQRITLSAGDFKNAQMRALKDWASIKKLEIVNAENVLFNNLLWV